MLAEWYLCLAPSISQLILHDPSMYEALSTCTQLLPNNNQIHVMETDLI